MEFHLDLFPARLSVSGAADSAVDRARQVRVIVADNQAMAFHIGPAGQVETVAKAELAAPFRLSGGMPYTVRTVDGDWTVTAGGGCGCGHPLKRANPSALVAVARAAA